MRNITGALIAAVLLAGPACMKNSSVPDAVGPSEAALSVRMSASPDTLPQDGVSKSTIGMQAFDSAGKPKAGVGLRLSVNGLGTVSVPTVVTGADGTATAVFTAPAPGATTTTAAVLATPTTTDVATASPFQVNIKLTQVGVVAPVPTVPSSAAPSTEYQFSPTTPVVGQTIFFNATQTVAAVGHYITLYDWDFADGVTDKTTGQFPTHVYSIAGTYNVLLTATDDAGAKSTKVHPITVGPGLPTVILLLTKNGCLVTADASASFAAPGATITNYTFIYSDGFQFSSASVPTTQHALPCGATYTITARVTDNFSRSNSSSQNITVP